MEEFNDIHDRELFIESKADELEIRRFNNHICFLTEQTEILEKRISDELIDDESLITEASDIKGKISSVVSTIVNKIKEMINAILDKISSVLDKKNDKYIDPEQYFSSEAATKSFECDIQKLTNECDKTIGEGQKLLRKLGSSAGVPDQDILTFEKAVDKVMKYAVPVTLTVAGAVGAVAFVKKKVTSWNDTIKKIDNGKSAIYKSAEANEIRKNSDLTKKQQEAKVLQLLSKVVSREKMETMGFVQKLYTKEVVKQKMLYK